jgi:nucleotide-binding universal stress UspA family protein
VIARLTLVSPALTCHDPAVYQSIVVGTDGSETAAIAVKHALELAKASGGTLHVVHAYENVALSAAVMASGGGGMAVDLQQLSGGLKENGENIVARVAGEAQAAGVQVQTHVVTSDPADALLTIAADVNADLIVVGNRGMSGIKRFMLGSVPNRVSHHCPCNLLIVNTSN